MATNKRIKLQREFLKTINEVNDQNIESKLQNISQINHPKKLYRYRRLNGYALEEIIKSYVYLASPNQFDDIFDSKCTIFEGEIGGALGAYKLLKDLSDRVEGIGDDYKYYEREFVTINKLADERLRIACFTENNKIIPMWYYYADMHRGICIEYDFSDFRFEPKDILLPVLYPGREINGYYSTSLRQGYENVTLVRNSLIKNLSWKFEKEWRMVYLEPNPPYRNVKISKIFFGINTPEVDKRNIVDLVNTYGLHIDLYEMKLDGIELVSKKMKGRVK